MAQQYGYGYGYGYAPGYGVQVAGYGATAGAAAPRPAQPASYQATAYTPPAKPTAAAPVAAPQQQGATQQSYYSASGAGSAAVNTPSSQQQPATTTPATSYYGYQQYRPTQQQQQQQQQQQHQQQPQQQQQTYTATYYQQQQQTAVKATPPAPPPTTTHQGVGYGSSPAVAAMAYPSTYSSPYYTASVTSNRYGTYNAGAKTTPAAGQQAVKPTTFSPVPSYNPSSAAYPSAGSYTSAQEKVIANYIAQKTTATGGGKFAGKKPYNTSNQNVYFCEVCKISCASSLTYKTHLEGKAHKKKLNSQPAGGGGGGAGSEGDGEQANKPYYCPLCEVQCTSKDSYEAHIRGSRHTKVLNLYRRLGKTIPDIKLPAGSEITTTVGGKKISVNAPRISFVGGQQLTSTGTPEKVGGAPSVYPPTAPTPTTAEDGGETVKDDKPTGNGVEEMAEVEPVGEQFVVSVSNDPKFPHATFKCTMCDCYFNDEWARKAHAKGRRHRLNYKKLYQPDLYVEPSKSNRKKAEQQKERRNSQGAGGGGGGVGGVRGRGRGWRGGGMGRGGAVREGGMGRGGGQMVVDADNLRRQEAEEISKLQAKNAPIPVQEMEQTEECFIGEGDMAPPGAPPVPYPHFEVEPPSHFYPSRPRNPRDDRLVMNKHGSICPMDSEIKAVQQAVADVETVLKGISDDILDETCKKLSEEQGTEVGRDEKHRKLKGVMRVGAFARSLMLRGECSVDLALMSTGKPTAAFFNDFARRMPAKFEGLSGEVVYNVSEDVGRAAILVISQVEEHRVQVTLTLTSTEMRDMPTPEQTQADEEAGVLHRPSCLAALAALRHTKWFQMMAQGLPSCSILMRVLKDICRRVPAWGVLDSWILELLVQRCLTSANPDYTRPGDMFRRVMECVASGIFLPGGTGLQDPCEKGLMDASACLSAQERVNITLSAQHALRLIAFRKAHLVLGVDPLAPPGARKDPPPPEGDNPPAEKEGDAGETAEAPEAKRPRVADQQQP